MPPVAAQKTCVKCVKSLAVATCDGCQQSFCDRHLPEHRQELTLKLENISKDYDHFREDLERQNDPLSILYNVNVWEKESIAKIQTAAQIARADLQQYTEQAKEEQDKVVDMITELRSNGQSSDFTEVDLTRWTEQLKELQRSLTRSSPMSIEDDDKTSSSIRSIKVNYESPEFYYAPILHKAERKIPLPPQAISFTDERFYKTVGRAKLSEKGRVATCFGYSSISGSKQYSTGIHWIRFRILAKRNDGLFFGIMSDSQEMTARATESASVYGWRDFARIILNGKAHPRVDIDKVIQNGDALTLALDCDSNRIVLTHHRTKRDLQLPIDIKACPFPWRLLVASFGDNCVGILD